MTGDLLLSIPDDSPAAFAAGYARHTGANGNLVATIVESAIRWHQHVPEACNIGLLARHDGAHAAQALRDEREARRRCEAFVESDVPRALGIIGWIQIALWLWRYRGLIREIIRFLRTFLADRPAALRAVREGPVRRS